MSEPRLWSSDELSVDHVVFHVGDVEARAAELVDGYGFDVYGCLGDAAGEGGVYSVALGKRDVRLVLTESRGTDHSASAYVEAHGDGVADIALGTPDARRAFAEAVGRGARPVAEPVEAEGMVIATVMGFGDVVHTFVERAPGGDPRALPGFTEVEGRAAEVDCGVVALDHFAVCLEPGELEPTVAFYENVFDFEVTFEEKIEVGAQAMNSKVVQSRSGAVTFTLIEPDTTRHPGQIDEFVKNHGGPGVQHLAFNSDDIVASVATMNERGVEFLKTPAAYYDLLAERTELVRHSNESLRKLNILVDEDHDGQLFQLFAKSTHPRNTYFFEVIERAGANTFGSGNIKALYEAVEAERQKSEGTSR